MSRSMRMHRDLTGLYRRGRPFYRLIHFPTSEQNEQAGEAGCKCGASIRDGDEQRFKHERFMRGTRLEAPVSLRAPDKAREALCARFFVSVTQQT